MQQQPRFAFCFDNAWPFCDPYQCCSVLYIKNINYQKDFYTSDLVSNFVHINCCCWVWIAIRLESFLCLFGFLKTMQICPKNSTTTRFGIPLLSMFRGKKNYLSFSREFGLTLHIFYYEKIIPYLYNKKIIWAYIKNIPRVNAWN